MLASCSEDPQGCFYESSGSMCTNGACSGAPGAAACCTNACTNGATQCVSGSNLETCSVAANGCSVFATSSCSTGSVCERYAPAACADPNWAEWPMPNGPADVAAAGAPNPESYQDNGDGTVTDNTTGLMWQQAVPAQELSWSVAAGYCPSLTLGGHNDWRLPTVIELMSLLDYGQVTGFGQAQVPLINGIVFPATPADPYWSSTVVGGSASVAWYVDFGYGVASTSAQSDPNNFRCVR
jgi:hypothetical protein